MNYIVFYLLVSSLSQPCCHESLAEERHDVFETQLEAEHFASEMKYDDRILRVDVFELGRIDHQATKELPKCLPYPKGDTLRIDEPLIKAEYYKIEY